LSERHGDITTMKPCHWTNSNNFTVEQQTSTAHAHYKRRMVCKRPLRSSSLDAGKNGDCVAFLSAI